MITKQEIIAILKDENPSLTIGNDDEGYTELSSKEYEATIAEWAEARLAKLAINAEKEALRQTKISAYTKLGLTTEEIEALLPSPKPIER